MSIGTLLARTKRYLSRHTYPATRMSKFLTQPSLTWVGGALPWRLKGELRFMSDTLGLVVVPDGFMTNLASVPRLPLVYMLTGGRANMPAVLHDFAYSNRCTWCPTRKQADGLFLEAMENAQDPERELTRDAMYTGVRVGGWRLWRKDDVPVDPPAVTEQEMIGSVHEET